MKKPRKVAVQVYAFVCQQCTAHHLRVDVTGGASDVAELGELFADVLEEWQAARGTPPPLPPPPDLRKMKPITRRKQ